MSQRHFLLNTTVPPGNQGIPGSRNTSEPTVVEVAEANYIVPLPWFACFQQSDLRNCTLEMEEPVEVELPCVGLEAAARNLSQSLPLFEKLTGEKERSREYWRRALVGLLKLQLPYVTIDVSEMLMVMSPEDLTQTMRAALGQDDRAIEAMRKSFFEYHDGVLPYKYDEFSTGTGAKNKQCIANSKALDAAIRYGYVGFRGERWRQQVLAGATSRGACPLLIQAFDGNA